MSHFQETFGRMRYGNLWNLWKPEKLSMSPEKSTDRLLTVAIGFMVSGFLSFRKLGNW
jgi:hypothetical protein